MLIMLVSVHWNLTPVSGRVSDMVFLDDSNPLTGFMLIDTAIWGEDGNFIDAVAQYDLACHCAGYYSAGGHCAYDTLLDAGSAGRRMTSAPRAPKG